MGQNELIRTGCRMNEDQCRLLRDGVPVKYREAAGQIADRLLKLVDFERLRFITCKI